jgi:glycosyltransferase involved in cell wall biosynthesis
MTTRDAPRLRIALVYDALYPFHTGGAERRVHELAVRLAERHDVHLVSWRFPSDGAGRRREVPPELQEVTIHGVGDAPEFYGADGRRTVREAAAFSARVLPHLLRHRYDVIDCSATPYLPVYACRLAALLTRTPLVVTWHEFWGEYWDAYLEDRPMVARAARAAEAGCRRFGDVAVAVSPFTAERLAAAGPGPAVRVVPNGVPLAEINAATCAEPPADVVFVGRLIADKRVDDLLRAVALLSETHPGLTCRIVGDGPERAELQRLAHELGVETSISFLGQIDDAEVFGHLKSAAILVLPSIREGYGITVVEGQAAGAVPVVVRSPMSAAPALVRDGIDGVVCDSGPVAIAASIARLLDDPSATAALRAGALDSASRRDWHRAAADMELVYQRTVARRRRVGDRQARMSWT